jgi:hypothetical protein
VVSCAVVPYRRLASVRLPYQPAMPPMIVPMQIVRNIAVCMASQTRLRVAPIASRIPISRVSTHRVADRAKHTDGRQHDDNDSEADEQAADEAAVGHRLVDP